MSTDLAVIVSYSLNHPSHAAVTIESAAAWNEHNPHLPIADGYDQPRQLGPVFNDRICYGERVADRAAARAVLRGHERRLGLATGQLCRLATDGQ